MSESQNRPLVARGAAIIAESFRDYVRGFRDVTRHARAHFESANWHGVQHDAAVRFDLYADAVGAGLRTLTPLLGLRIDDRPTWTALRGAFAAEIAQRGDVELAESFFNSFTRKIFHTIGVDPAEHKNLSAPVRSSARAGASNVQLVKAMDTNANCFMTILRGAHRS